MSAFSAKLDAYAPFNLLNCVKHIIPKQSKLADVSVNKLTSLITDLEEGEVKFSEKNLYYGKNGFGSRKVRRTNF